MISSHALETSVELAEKLSASGYVVTSVHNSPLDKLNACTVLTNPSLIAENSNQINTGIISALTNSPDQATGMCEHDVRMNEISKFVIEKLMAQVSYARNEGAGAIEELAQNVQAHIDSLTSLSEAGAEIIERTYPVVLLNDSLLEEIQQSHNAVRHSVVIGFRLPQKSASEIRALMRTGLPSLDGLVSEYIADIGDVGLVNIWNTLFTEASPAATYGNKAHMLEHYITGDKNLKTALIVFLISRRLCENIIEDANMTASEYMRVASDYRNQSAARICDVLDQFSREDKNEQLVYNYSGLKITVNSTAYRKYLNSGGSAEALYGAILSGNKAPTTNLILDNLAKFESLFTRQYTLNRQTFQNMKFQKIKEILLLEYNSQVENTSLTEFPEHERLVSQEIFKKILREISIDEVDNITMLCLKLLGKSRFRNKNVYEILSKIAYVRKKNPDIQPAEAATVAIIEYVSKWVASMFVISKNGQQIKCD